MPLWEINCSFKCTIDWEETRPRNPEEQERCCGHPMSGGDVLIAGKGGEALEGKYCTQRMILRQRSQCEDAR